MRRHGTLAVLLIGVCCLFVGIEGSGQAWDPFNPGTSGSSPADMRSVGGDLSDGRALGTGFQVNFPLFYGASMRFWFYDLDMFGIEVIAFGSDLYHEEVFETTVRGLGKFYDARVTDFYVAVGVTYKYFTLVPHVALGMEVSISSEIAVNFEVGVGVVGNDTYPFLGGGVHFYF